jgi:hypothetical protein
MILFVSNLPFLYKIVCFAEASKHFYPILIFADKAESHIGWYLFDELNTLTYCIKVYFTSQKSFITLVTSH